MLKKMLKGMVVLGAAALLAAPVQADTFEVNLYGASAQFKYWTDAADDFLEDATNGPGCAPGTAVNLQGKTTNTTPLDAGIAKCSVGGDTYIVRYVARSSVEGVFAVRGIDGTGEGADGCPADQRLFPTDIVSGAISGYSCQVANVGASDVAAETFNQKSKGCDVGPECVRDGSETILDLDVSGVSSGGLAEGRPVIVPFAFFANDDVPIDDINRPTAVAIYSGQMSNWSAVDPTVDLDVVACLRHAGSGTHATLDANVMRGEAALLTQEAFPGDGGLFDRGRQIETYFNLSSSNARDCCRAEAGWGAICYMDADKCGVDGTECDNTTTAMKRLTYNGAAPTAENIENGLYTFWSAQWLYYDDSATNPNATFIENLIAFGSNPDNIQGDRAQFWTGQAAMNWVKGDDFSLQIPK